MIRDEVFIYPELPNNNLTAFGIINTGIVWYSIYMGRSNFMKIRINDSVCFTRLCLPDTSPYVLVKSFKTSLYFTVGADSRVLLIPHFSNYTHELKGNDTGISHSIKSKQ